MAAPPAISSSPVQASRGTNRVRISDPNKTAVKTAPPTSGRNRTPMWAGDWCLVRAAWTSSIRATEPAPAAMAIVTAATGKVLSNWAIGISGLRPKT